jgi:putative ABC transport system permease protein
MMFEMISRNILHRPIRTFITVIAVAVEVIMVLTVVGLTHGLVTDTAKRVEGIGADVMVQPPSASVFMAFSGAPMPISLGDKLQELKYVHYVAPVLLQFSSSGRLDIVYGIDPASFALVSGGFVFHEGHDLQNPNDILVDDWYAKAKNLHAGDSMSILEHQFHVAGIVEHGKGARLFVQLRTLQELSGAQDKASVFFIKCERPDDASTVTEEIQQILPRYEVRSLKDYMSLMTSSNLPGLQTFINVMIGLAVCIGFMVIFLSMYTTILERTREIGVLKSLGASKTYIVRVVLGETTLLCAVGAGIGAAAAFLITHLLVEAFPTLVILIQAEWVFRAILIAIVGGLLGAAYPAWLASRRDPIEALAYE